MILSITDGIEVAEHTEPAERCEFLFWYKEMIVWHERARAFDEIINQHCALTARQAEYAPFNAVASCGPDYAPPKGFVEVIPMEGKPYLLPES